MRAIVYLGIILVVLMALELGFAYLAVKLKEKGRKQ